METDTISLIPPGLLQTQPKPEVVTPSASFDLSSGRPEAFPIRALPAQLVRLSEQLAYTYQVPVCLPAMSALGILAGALGKGVAVRGAYRDKDTRLNLYVIAVAERGSGKGNVGVALIKPLAELSRRLADQKHQEQIAERAEIHRLVAETKKLEKTATTDADLSVLGQKLERLDRLNAGQLITPSLLIQDATSEAMTRSLAQNGEAQLCYSSEGGGVIEVALGKYSADKQADINILLSSYSGDWVATSRMGRPGESLNSPALSLLLMFQYAVLQRLLDNKESFDRGLTARMLTFNTEAAPQIDDGRRSAYSSGDEWEELILSAVSLRVKFDGAGEDAEPTIIRCLDEAQTIFTNFHNESVMLERLHFADFSGELSRWRENAIKVAGILAFAGGLFEITPEIASDGCAIVRWAGYNYLAMLKVSRRSRMKDDIRNLVEHLKANGSQESLSRLDDHGYTAARLARIVAAAPELFVREKVKPTIDGEPVRGRPAEFIRLRGKAEKEERR